MDFIVPLSDKEVSVRKQEEWEKITKIVQWGRSNPAKFIEVAFDAKNMDFQNWMIMDSWHRKFVLWLLTRGGSKTTTGAEYMMAKTILIPNHPIYISTLTFEQSIVTFKKIEDLAMQNVPSFKTFNDLFAREVEKGGNSATGFIHDRSGHSFQVYNSSFVKALSSNYNAIRGKRGSVFYDESAFHPEIAFQATEPYASVDTDFSIGTGLIDLKDPEKMPYQLLYASSAGDMSYPFYNKYVEFSKKMIMGDPNYLVVNLDANTIINFTTVDGYKRKSHLSQADVDKMVAEDPDRAEKEYFNKFTAGGGKDAVVSMENILKCTRNYRPVFSNDTGDRKFLFCYDPARNFDNSILAVFEIINDKEKGKILRLVNMVSFVDTESVKKTPIMMPEQINMMRKMMVAYNGDAVFEWDNLLFYIDAGAGGGGISAVGDQLIYNWHDEMGQEHLGVIDPNHKQYETAKRKFPDARPIVSLIEPSSHKRIIFDALDRCMKNGLIELPAFDGKDVIYVSKEWEDEKEKDEDGNPIMYTEVEEHTLSFNEKLSLQQCELAKTEMRYVCRSVSASGAISYDLEPSKKNIMHKCHCAVAA